MAARALGVGELRRSLRRRQARRGLGTRLSIRWRHERVVLLARLLTAEHYRQQRSCQRRKAGPGDMALFFFFVVIFSGVWVRGQVSRHGRSGSVRRAEPRVLSLERRGPAEAGHYQKSRKPRAHDVRKRSGGRERAPARARRRFSGGARRVSRPRVGCSRTARVLSDSTGQVTLRSTSPHPEDISHELYEENNRCFLLRVIFVSSWLGQPSTPKRAVRFP